MLTFFDSVKVVYAYVGTGNETKRTNLYTGLNDHAHSYQVTAPVIVALLIMVYEMVAEPLRGYIVIHVCQLQEPNCS